MGKITVNPNLFAERRVFSEGRLRELRDKIKDKPSVRDLPGLCIYIAGSYGRMEAFENSDMDLFLFHTGSHKDGVITSDVEAQLLTDVLNTGKEMRVPKFTNNGMYLKVHYLNDLLAEMGGREDDSHNHFTARMLLLLEGQWIFNEGKYKLAIHDIVESYCRDYYDSDKTFINAVFLINDILRYWRTMCVNYEHRRNEQKHDPKERDKNNLRNIKLKFSRMLICFSAVLLLVREGRQATPEELSRIVGLSPMARLSEAAEGIKNESKRASAIKRVEKMRENYAWFLTVTGKTEEEVLGWIRDPKNFKNASKKGGQFGDDMHRLLKDVAGNSGMMRYLVL